MEFRGFTLLQAAEFLKSRRCRVSPNGGYVDALVANEKQLREEGHLLGNDMMLTDCNGTQIAIDTAGCSSSAASDFSDVISVFRRSWLSDFRAGRVKPKPVDRIL